MLNKFEMYFAQGLHYLKSGVVIAIIVYCIMLTALWMIGKRSFIKRHISIKKIILEYLLVLYIITILQITGIIGMSFHISWFVEEIQFLKLSIPFIGSSVLMITLNLILFIPLGFLIPFVFKSDNWNCNKVLLIGFLLSFCIEFLQLFGGRFFEIDDIVANTFGTLVGYLLWESAHGILEEKIRNKSVIKGMCTILGTAIILFTISFIANGDALNEQQSVIYSEMGISETEINDIAQISFYTYGDETEITDSTIYAQLYAFIGIDISNNISSYVNNEYDNNLNNIIENSYKEYLEILFNEKHNFTFYNNEDLVLEDVRHILYDLNDGTIYFGKDSSDNLTNVLKYENKEYPFKINQKIYEIINNKKALIDFINVFSAYKEV